MTNPQLILLLIILVVAYLLLTEKEVYRAPRPSVPPAPSLHHYDEESKEEEKPWLSREERAYQSLVKGISQEEIETWSNIHFSFSNPELIQNWKRGGHNHITARQWIKVGFKPTEHELVEWIRTVKVHEIKPYKNFSGYSYDSPTWVINHYGSIEPLRREWQRSKSGEGIEFFH